MLCSSEWAKFAGLHCICAPHHFGVMQAASTQQIRSVQRAFCHVAQAQTLVHGGLAQLVKGRLFGEVLPVYQQAVCAVDGCAVLQLRPDVGQFAPQTRFMLEGRHGHVEDGAYAFGQQSSHDVSEHPCCNGIFHLAGVAVVGEQHNRASRVARRVLPSPHAQANPVPRFQRPR